jgi:hypothetical protein
MDGGQAKPNAERAAVRPPQALSAPALDKKLGLRKRARQYDRLTIMRISVRRPQEPSILFSKCLPRPPEDTNPLFENARLTQATWDEEFGLMEVLHQAA